MTTYESSFLPAPPMAEVSAPRGPSRVHLGVLAVIAGLGGTAGAMMGLPTLPRDAEHETASLASAVIALGETRFRVSAALLGLAAVALAILGSAACRYLDVQLPAGSMLRRLASIGVTVSVAGLAAGSVGAASLAWVIRHRDGGLVAPYWVVMDAVPFAAFSGLGLIAAAFAVAALREAAAPRWFGWVSAVLTVVFAGLLLGGIPFMAWAPGALWLLALPFAVGGRGR